MIYGFMILSLRLKFDTNGYYIYVIQDTNVQRASVLLRLMKGQIKL